MAKTELVKFDTSPTALARITSIDDVKKYAVALGSTADVLKAAGRTQRECNLWLEKRIRVLRRGGELLEDLLHRGGRQKRGGDRKSKLQDVTLIPTLTDLGVSKMQASRWQTLAGIDQGEFDEFCEARRSAEDRLTITAALKLAKPGVVPESVGGDIESCTVDDLHKLIEAGHTFGTMYADPPWAYGNQATRASTDNHYKTVSTAWLCDPDNMPIEKLAEDTAHLHLWTTNAFLFEARQILEAWGFTYKSCFVWVKTQMGIGNYWRVSHEFLLLGVRGKLTFRDKGLKSWGEFKRCKHSDKPDQVRTLIERASPKPRLELFGRRAVPGWVVWGNEISRDLFTEEMAEL